MRFSSPLLSSESNHSGDTLQTRIAATCKSRCINVAQRGAAAVFQDFSTKNQGNCAVPCVPCVCLREIYLIDRPHNPTRVRVTLSVKGVRPDVRLAVKSRDKRRQEKTGRDTARRFDLGPCDQIRIAGRAHAPTPQVYPALQKPDARMRRQVGTWTRALNRIAGRSIGRS